MFHLDRDYDLGELNAFVIEDQEEEEEEPHGEGIDACVILAIVWFALAALALCLGGALHLFRDG